MADLYLTITGRFKKNIAIVLFLNMLNSVTNNPINSYNTISLAKSVLRERKLCLSAPLKSFTATPREAICHVTMTSFFFSEPAMFGCVFFCGKIIMWKFVFVGEISVCSSLRIRYFVSVFRVPVIFFLFYRYHVKRL